MADASPMLLLRPIENDLRTLADAARRSRHGASDVKEAAERGILKIRQLQESYSKALRLQRTSDAGAPAAAAGLSPDALRQNSEDVLRPFLLACNHTDAGEKVGSTRCDCDSCLRLPNASLADCDLFPSLALRRARPRAARALAPRARSSRCSRSRASSACSPPTRCAPTTGRTSCAC